jgi:quinol monooxygenase YgiN
MNLVTRTLSRIAVTILLSFTLANAAMAENHYETRKFTLKEGQSQAFQDLMKEALVDTRGFKGCQYVMMLVDKDDPNKVFLYLKWDTEKDFKAYTAWRTETKFRESLGPYLAAPIEGHSYRLIQE